jgi:hypothetical protein
MSILPSSTYTLSLSLSLSLSLEKHCTSYLNVYFWAFAMSLSWWVRTRTHNTTTSKLCFQTVTDSLGAKKLYLIVLSRCIEEITILYHRIWFFTTVIVRPCWGHDTCVMGKKTLCAVSSISMYNVRFFNCFEESLVGWSRLHIPQFPLQMVLIKNPFLRGQVRSVYGGLGFIK